MNKLTNCISVLFIDIDGVLISFNAPQVALDAEDLYAAYRFDKKAVVVLNEIIQKTNCEIVISSDWRHHYTLEELKRIFSLNEIIKEPIDVTIYKGKTTLKTLEVDRCFEIMEWVNKNTPVKWCAVDDLDLSELGESHFILCKRPYREGIKQTNIKEKIINKL